MSLKEAYPATLEKYIMTEGTVLESASLGSRSDSLMDLLTSLGKTVYMQGDDNKNIYFGDTVMKIK